MGVVSSMPSNSCSGSNLPDDVQMVNCVEPIQYLSDCCARVDIEDEILLYDHIRSERGDYYYWISLSSDETPLTVCALEKYAEQTAWTGRRADYLGMGWYSGDCYVVVTELRHALVTEERFEDKLDQLEQSIAWIVSNLLADFTKFDTFTYACDNPEYFKIVGAMIPVSYSKKRAEQTRQVRIGEHETVILAIPNSILKECRISWGELLRAIGV
jgi:hypothetical protein